MSEISESGVGDAIAEGNSGEQLEYVTMTIGGQWFGIPVLSVQDVLGPQNIAMIPLAPPEVAGSLNLRGRIVTAIDPRVRLGLPDREEDATVMSVVVEHLGYSLSQRPCPLAMDDAEFCKVLENRLVGPHEGRPCDGPRPWRRRRASPLLAFAARLCPCHG